MPLSYKLMDIRTNLGVRKLSYNVFMLRELSRLLVESPYLHMSMQTLTPKEDCMQDSSAKKTKLNSNPKASIDRVEEYSHPKPGCALLAGLHGVN